MIILRQNNFSKKDSRYGIGWMQDGMKKNQAERVFREAKKAADLEESKGGDIESQVKKSKRAARRRVLKDEVPIPLLKTAGVTAGSYAAAKLLQKFPLGVEIRGINLSPRDIKFIGKHSGKIATGAGLATAAVQLSKSKIGKKLKGASNGAEINTRARNSR